MESILAPWRFQYVTSAGKEPGCVFCNALLKTDESDSLIVYRGDFNFVILNRYPYNNGHIMIAPYQHAASPLEVAPAILQEMTDLFQRGIRALTGAYHPDGFNTGMNLGRSAGAGVEQHYHLHIVPRWNGDTSFMATLAETRVIPEDFVTTLSKLKPLFER
jgi:ATP adenylyltransferase